MPPAAPAMPATPAMPAVEAVPQPAPEGYASAQPVAPVAPVAPATPVAPVASAAPAVDGASALKAEKEWVCAWAVRRSQQEQALNELQQALQESAEQERVALERMREESAPKVQDLIDADGRGAVPEDDGHAGGARVRRGHGAEPGVHAAV